MTNKCTQLFHKLSHCYMFRQYRVILRQLVINTLPSYTSISDAAIGNTSAQLRCFTQVVCQFWYYSCWNVNIIKSLKHKIVLFTIKLAKIFMLLQFSWSQSVWWLYIHTVRVCWGYCRAGPVRTYVKDLNCKLYYQQLHLKYLCNLARYWLQAVWGWQDSVETCSSVIICEIKVKVSRDRLKWPKGSWLG